MEENTNQTMIQVIANGPLKIKGKLLITKEDGTIIEKEIASFCRCGASTNKPFCDGTHRENGFEG